MESSWTQDVLNWIASHPGWSGLLVFLVAFIESLILVGILIPGIVILFGMGAMIGLGVLDLATVWIWSSVGAVAGDSLSYYIGRHYQGRLADIWPFSRYPGLLARGEAFFQKHGTKGVVAGRFIGPLRPIVPAVAGTLGMQPGRFFTVNIPACILWAPAYLLPGMLFGASLEAAAEYAGRLALVLVILVTAILLIWWLIRSLYEVLASRSARWLRHTIRWSRRHPHLGRLTSRLLDPNQPEVLSVSMLGLMLVAVFWAIVVALSLGPFTDKPQVLDQNLHQYALALRNHLADPVMVALSEISRWWVLLLPATALLLWLWGAGRKKAAAHWLAAMLGGIVLQLLLGWTLGATPLVSELRSNTFIPSADMTLATVVLGFFAVMIARELHRRSRKWPYLFSSLLLTLLLMSRLYLGLEWFSGALLGVLLGVAWTVIVGIAYRQRAGNPFSGGIASLIFYGAMILVLIWQIRTHLPEDLESFKLALPQQNLQQQLWWQDAWQTAPRQRTHLQSVAAREFNLQVGMPLENLQQALQAQGWRDGDVANWQWLLLALNPNLQSDELPLLNKDYLGYPEVLLYQKLDTPTGRLFSLRLWESGIRLQPDDQPLYLGLISEENLIQRFHMFSYWRAKPVEQNQVNSLLSGLNSVSIKPASSQVLLLRSP